MIGDLIGDQIRSPISKSEIKFDLIGDWKTDPKSLVTGRWIRRSWPDVWRLYKVDVDEWLQVGYSEHHNVSIEQVAVQTDSV